MEEHMAFDGLVVSAVAVELDRLLLNGKIEKIYQPASDEIVLHIRNNHEKYMLFISANPGHAGIYITENKDSNPQNPPAFCMLLRKHLQSARIRSISQVDSERIICIDTDSLNELGFKVRYRLIAEIMGKHSNILLVDMNTGKIADSIKHLSFDVNRYRQTLPGVKYVSPPSHGKRSIYDISREDFTETVQRSGKSAEKALVSSIQGISPSFASELCFRASEKYGPDHSGDDLYYELSGILDDIHSGSVQPAVYRDKDGTPRDFHAVPLTMYEDSLTVDRFDSISAACENFFESRESSNRMHQRSSDLRRSVSAAIARLQRKVQNLNEDLMQAEDSEKYRLYGELLTASIHLVKPGSKSAEIPNYYDGSTITVPLDVRFSPSRNAQLYFKKYGKSKTALIEKKKQLAETEKEIKYLESVLFMTEQAERSEDLDDIRFELAQNGYMKAGKQFSRRRKMKIRPYRYRISSGMEVLVGRNNIENDLLTFHEARAGDYWLHTKDFHGSHTILVTKGEAPSETDLHEAALIAAYHSKARLSSSVPVDCTKVKYVKKPSGSPPGFVVFTHNRTIYVDPEEPVRFR